MMDQISEHGRPDHLHASLQFLVVQLGPPCSTFCIYLVLHFQSPIKFWVRLFGHHSGFKLVSDVGFSLRLLKQGCFVAKWRIAVERLGASRDGEPWDVVGPSVSRPARSWVVSSETSDSVVCPARSMCRTRSAHCWQLSSCVRAASHASTAAVASTTSRLRTNKPL